MSGAQLKQDNGINRYPDRSARHEAVDPLTPAEIARLVENCQDYCIRSYKIRMIKSALISDYEEHKDLDGEAIIFMYNILGKFDKSKCGGIADFDEKGATKPKTLEFYFKNYFSGRVNFVACEAREDKKKKGIGPGGSVFDVSYDEEAESEFSEVSHEYEATSAVFAALKNKTDDFKRFFAQNYFEEMQQKELREEWGPKFSKLKSELGKFKNDLKKKHTKSYLREIGKV